MSLWRMTVLDPGGDGHAAADQACTCPRRRGRDPSYPADKVTWITERTSAGTTTICGARAARQLLKQPWPISLTPNGQRSTWWRVTTTGQMDHDITRAWCGA
jgi:hypothetical protein